MSNELDKIRDTALQSMMDVECLPAMPDLDLAMNNATKIPLANLSALGVAFQPLTTAIQTAVTGGGGSGLYYVNTKGMQMFSTSDGFIGSLKTASGTVGGGQARMTALACDPTMLFMAAALMNIEKKLDAIQETQEEILEFLEEKERAVLQGNLNVLDVVFKKNSKYYVVEFQHSAISYDEFVARTNFYMNQGYGMIWIFDFCSISPQKTMYYTEIEDSDWIQVFWPGKDRLRFLDRIDFNEYGETLHIYFHISTGKGRKIIIESDSYFDWEHWEYINPFQRERLFIKLHLATLYSMKEFFALPYSEAEFYKMLKDTGKNQD